MKTLPETPKGASQTLHRVSHCLYRSDESNVYYAILKRAGKQIKRFLKTTDSTLARRCLRELEDRAVHLQRGESGKITIADLGQRWLVSAGVSLKMSSSFQSG